MNIKDNEEKNLLTKDLVVVDEHVAGGIGEVELVAADGGCDIRGTGFRAILLIFFP